MPGDTATTPHRRGSRRGDARLTPVAGALTYRVVSEDGHPVEGTVASTAPAGPAPPAPEPSAAASGAGTPSPTSTPAPSATAAPDAQPTAVQPSGSSWTTYLSVGGLAVLLLVLLAVVRRRGRPDPS